MAERQVVLDREVDDQDQQVSDNQQDQALQAATERAEQAEADLARLKASRAQTASAADRQDAEGVSAQVPHAGSGAHAAHDVQLQGTEALRQDSMMNHLLDALAAGQDIGHYGRLVFTMVARHFLSEDEMIAELTSDPDFSTDQAVAMLRQVSERDYSPPRRERILEWQQEQEFVLLPEPNDPDCGNVYRTLHFPTRTYKHIEQYQEERAEA